MPHDKPLKYGERLDLIWEAARIPQLPPLALRVLIAINRHYNSHHGYAWPSHSTLATELRASRSSVTRAVARLSKEFKFIRVEKGKVEGSRWLGNRYYLIRKDPDPA